MSDDKDKLIKNQQKKIRKLESALKIVASHSGKTENRMRKQFEVISQTIPVPMFIAEENGDILYANLNARKTFGYPFENFPQADSLYKNPADRKLFLKILSDKGEVKSFRVELKKSDESVFPASIFSQKMYFDGQESILTIVHDLTELMTLERQLRHTQKMEAIGTLAGGIAHDFNNILSVIFGYTELTADLLDPEKDKDKKGYLNNVLKAASRAKSMIRQMMTFCRLSEKEKKPFYISTIVSEVVKMLSHLTPSDIDIQSDIRAKDMVVMGDPAQIHQVVTNLITNSVHALSDKGGRIEIILDKEAIVKRHKNRLLIPMLKPGTYAKITVKDNGPGIGKGIIHNIFDPFFTTKPVGQGSGMGLSVVHGIIQGHKGAIRVESEAGRGAAFYCYFPVTERDQNNEKPNFTTESIEKGDERILIADDDSMVLNLFIKILERKGYQVTPCLGSREALEIFKDKPNDFDLVITDNIMPEMSGASLAEEIGKIRPDIPIVLVTGTLKRADDLKRAGISSIIKKPFDLKKIQSIIRKVLDERQ